jgi:hypothetical protein
MDIILYILHGLHYLEARFITNVQGISANVRVRRLSAG